MLAYVENISPSIAPVRSNTGEISGSSLVQRQKYALMVPNPRENSRGGRISRETSEMLAYVEKVSPRVASVRSNTGETSSSRSLQRQKNAVMVPNLRENSRGGRTSRDTSGKLAYVRKTSPRIASARSNTERPTVVIRYSAKERPRWHRTRERTHEGGALPERSVRERLPQQKARYRQRWRNAYSCRRVFTLFPGWYLPDLTMD